MENMDPNQIDGIIQQIFAWAQTHEWFQYVVASFLGLKVLTTVLPSQWNGFGWYKTAYNVAMKFINVYTLNVGRAKNADDKL